MERDKYRILHKKIRKIESKLIPILSTPLNPEITPSQQPVVQTFHHNLHFMNNLLSAEMASSTEPQHLAHFVKRVIRLQRAVHSWTEGRTLTPYVESSGSDPGSFIESCVTDDDDVGCDYKGEVSGLAGFTVYENPLFDGIVDSDDYDDDADNDDSDDDADNDNDNDDVGIIDEYEVEETEGGEEEDLIRVIDQGEEHESDAGNEGVEKEVIKVDYQKEDGKEQEKEEEDEDEDEDEEEEEGTQNCCYKILFWSLIIVMVVIFAMLILSHFPDNHAPVLLTPT